MARKGRKFELLIEKLEKAVLPEDATIASPGFLRDRVTNEPREVDILIEYKLGTSLIQIVIECRDRSSTQDVTWIEQIHTKVNDLKVHKVIAVSSSSFTKPAKEKALFYGIETRIYAEIDYDLINAWWQVEHIKMLTNHFTIIAANIESDNGEDFQEFLNDKNADDKFINRTTDDKIFSLNDIFTGVTGKIKDWMSLVPNSKPLRKTIILNYTNPDDRFILKVNGDEVGITKITFVADLRVIAKEVPISKVASYSGDENSISHVIEYDGVPIGDNQILQLIRNPDGSISMSARKK